MPELVTTRQVGRHMSLDRRTFLKGSAGAMALLVVQTAYERDALAQDPLSEGFRFFNPVQAETVAAIAERLWPTTDDSPGAIEAGVVHYIDHSLNGPYARYRLTYIQGLKWIDAVSQEQYGAPFRNLEPEQQDAILTGIEAGEIVRPQAGQEDGATGDQTLSSSYLDGLDGETARQIAGISPPATPDLKSFFNVIRTHTMEGLFADPIYGGNRNFAGWRAVGYPGPYYVYTEEEQQSFEPLNKPFQSIADL
mgnify:FL=1